MSKKYNTGKFTWEYEQDCHYENGYPTHKFLGPCPDCGRVTFNYGGGWRCVGDYCNRNAGNPAGSVGKAPEWWNTDINVFLDGNSWCATRDGFINPQESNAGFGDTPHKAVLDLIEYEKGGGRAMAKHPCLFDERYNCNSAQCSGEWCSVYVIREIEKEGE